MHELALAHSIVRECAARAGAARVRRVTVEVGTLTCVLPESLEFCFPLAAAGSVVEGAALEMIRVAGHSRCRACGREVLMNDPLSSCECGSIDLDPPQGGTHLRIRSMEVQDEVTTRHSGAIAGLAGEGTRLRRQDAGANIGAADGPQGEPQDAASLSSFPIHQTDINADSGSRPGPGLVRNDEVGLANAE